MAITYHDSYQYYKVNRGKFTEILLAFAEQCSKSIIMNRKEARRPMVVMQDLKRHRLSKGWTLKQAANEIGVCPATYYNWENGKKEPRPKQFPKIAKLFKIDAFELTKIIDPTPG